MSGVQLSVGAEMEAYGDQAVAASSYNCAASLGRKQETLRLPTWSGTICKISQRSLYIKQTTSQDSMEYIDSVQQRVIDK